MNKYPVSYVQIHICELLEELPFQITRYGKIIAVVNGPSAGNVTVKQIETKTPLVNLKGQTLCPHGALFGLCKKGCK